MFDSDDAHEPAGPLTRLWAIVIRPLTVGAILVGLLLGLSALGMLGRSLAGAEATPPTEPLSGLALGIAIIVTALVIRHRSTHLRTSYDLLDKLDI